MVVAEAIISAVIALAVAAGFEKVTSKKDGDTTVVVGTKNGKEVVITKFRNEAIASPQADATSLKSTLQKRDPENANYTIINDSSVDKRIFSLGFVPVDTNTRNKGVIEIWLNEKRLFPITDPAAGMLKNLNDFNIPIPANFGYKIQQDKSLQVFLYNGTDATQVEVIWTLSIGNMV